MKHETRMNALVRLGDTPADCWEWLGSKNPTTGYGKKQYCGRTLLAHRWMVQILLGNIPEGLVVNHLCSNRGCVNPHHLELTTTAGNVRHGRGTKLTLTKVAEIKAAKKTAVIGDRAALAHKYGVSPALISDIWYGRAWETAA